MIKNNFDNNQDNNTSLPIIENIIKKEIIVFPANAVKNKINYQ